MVKSRWHCRWAVRGVEYRDNTTTAVKVRDDPSTITMVVRARCYMAVHFKKVFVRPFKVMEPHIFVYFSSDDHEKYECTVVLALPCSFDKLISYLFPVRFISFPAQDHCEHIDTAIAILYRLQEVHILVLVHSTKVLAGLATNFKGLVLENFKGLGP